MARNSVPDYFNAIDEAEDLVRQEYAGTRDALVLARVKEVLRFLEIARRNLEILQEVKKLSKQKVIIVRPNGQVEFATNAQLVKLAIMKGSLKNGDNEVNSGKHGDGNKPAQVSNVEREIQGLHEQAIFREAFPHCLTRVADGLDLGFGAQEQETGSGE